MNPQDIQDIRDIRPPVYFPANYSLLIAIAAVIALVALFFLGRAFLKIMRERGPGPAAPAPKSAHQIALEALLALQAKNLPGAGKIKEYYFELSDIIRHYLEGRFNIRAPEMTTEEFLYFLRDSQSLYPAHKEMLREFLTLCDIVKFARYGPTGIEIKNSFDAAVKLVNETKGIAEEEMALEQARPLTS